MQIKQLIENFIANICQKNYADANNDLKNIIEAKLRQKIGFLVEKKASPAQKEARKKFFEKLKAKKASVKKGAKKGTKKSSKKKVTEEGFEKKPFDSKGFKKLYGGPTFTKPKYNDRGNTDKTEEYNKRKDAVKKSSKKGIK
jgi:hypothetical protein